MEAAFVLRGRDTLVRRLRVIAAISFAAAAVGLAFDISPGGLLQRERYPTEIAWLAARVKTVGCACFVGMSLLATTALSMQRLVRSLRPEMLELIAIFVLIAHMALLLTLPTYAVKILGYSLDEAYGEARCASDTHLLLLIDCMITAAHAGCPLRWCSLVHMEVAGILMYLVVVFVVGSNEPMSYTISSIVILTTLVVVTALGKRGVEIGERQAFQEIIKERSLRCQAEYELTQQVAEHRNEPDGEERRSVAESHVRSAPDSVPTTAPSNQIFDLNDNQDTSVEAKLQDIVELGGGEHWRIDEAEVQVQPDEVLGAGSFGRVVKGTFCGVVVAVKLAHEKFQAADSRRLSALCNELQVLRHLRHPNVVAMHGATINPRELQLAIVLEFVRGAVLKHVVRGGGGEGDGARLGIAARCQLMLGVCSALLYLHSRHPHVAHGDLKHSNVMVVAADEKLIPKLLDFGLSRVITRRARQLGGTLKWMAPELCQVDAPVKCSSDVYSFGHLIVFIATGNTPLQKMRATKIRRLLWLGRPPLPTWPETCAFKPNCEALVQACLRVGEGERPRIAEIHRKLKALPRDLGVAERHRHAFEDLEIASAFVDAGFKSAIRGYRDSPEEAGQPLVVEPSQEPSVGERLCPLPEDAPLGGTVEAEPLGGCAEGSPSAASATPQPAPSHGMETTLEAMEVTLVEAVARWNFDRPTYQNENCCQRHAALRLAKLVCTMGLTWPCDPEPLPHHSTRCKYCGILGIAGRVCDVCQVAQSDTANAQMASL